MNRRGNGKNSILDQKQNIKPSHRRSRPTYHKASSNASVTQQKRISFASQKYPRSADSATPAASKELLRQMSMGEILESNCQVISNKVAPVVIRNCKEEFQMRAETTVKLGKLYEHLTEHDLLMNKYFLLKDHFVGIDRADTLDSHGVPNLRQCTEKPTVYAIGQPTLNGVNKFVKSVSSKFNNVLYVNVRAVPTLFLRRAGDFLPYSAYNKSIEPDDIITNERDLNNAERELQMQALGIATRNDGLFYFYNALDSSADEPHMYKIKDVRDLVTSRQLNSSIQSDIPNFRYTRLPLFDLNQPTPQWIDSLMQVFRESGVLFDTNSAVIFQGLTGEGPACIAMMITGLLATMQKESTVQANEKNLSVMRLIESKVMWRSYLLQELFKDKSLYCSSVYQSVEAVISLSFGEPLMLKFIKNMASKLKFQNSLEWILSQTVKQGISTEDKTVNKEAAGTSMNASLSLRDISELNLLQQHNQTMRCKSVVRLTQPQSIDGSFCSHDSSECTSSLPSALSYGDQKTHYRHEIFEEEDLIARIFLVPDLFISLVIFAEYLNSQLHRAMQYTFEKWLTLNSKYLMHLAQMRDYCDNPQHEQAITYLKAKSPLSVSTIGSNLFAERNHRVVGYPIFGIGHILPKDYADGIRHICREGARKKYDHVVFINLKNEIVLYTDDCTQEIENDGNRINSEQNDEHVPKASPVVGQVLWEVKDEAFPCLFGAKSQMLEDVEERLCQAVNSQPQCVCLLNYIKSVPPLHSPFQTTKQIVENILNTREELQLLCQSAINVRLPLPKYRIPSLEEFDRLTALIRDSHQNDPATAFIFYCHNGKRRTANMMAAACLIMGHLTSFPSSITASLQPIQQWVPDAEFARGEFKVVLDILQIIPDSHLRKLEVDAVLDLCYETMSTMHYHLRENLNPAHKKADRSTNAEDKIKYTIRSVQGLEFYVYLILFNCYLSRNKVNLWRDVTFEKWMKEYASRLGVMDIMNELSFNNCDGDNPFTKVYWRWLSHDSILNQVIGSGQPSSFSLTWKHLQK